MEIPPSPATTTPLRRRNTIATTTSALTTDIPFSVASSPAALDLEFISLKPPSFVAYTSLRDIISSPNSTSFNSTAISSCSSPVLSTVGDISIRNRLVKQAAWSYLQPTVLSSSSDSSGSQFFHRLWLHFSAGLQFLKRMFDWILQSIRVPLFVK